MEITAVCTRGTSAAMEVARLEDRVLLMEHLAAAIKYVEEGNRLLRRQRARIHFLIQTGRDTVLAELVLARLAASQAVRNEDREKFEELLAAVSG